MGSSIKVSKKKNKENESAKPNPIIENIKSRYILSKIYNNIPKIKKLKMNMVNLSILMKMINYFIIYILMILKKK